MSFHGVCSRALIWVAAGVAHAGLLSPVWVELGEQGRVLARVVVTDLAACPAIRLDGKEVPMAARVPVPDGMQPVCELLIPANVEEAQTNGRNLALPRPDPAKIVAIGDTGCRIKGKRAQNCNDPALWPLQRVTSQAATEKPDLVIHVGDYLYREDKCPQDLTHLCGTSPAGDRWETWNADFFEPAARLLAAAPWIFARGNHEDCARSWKGWYYYLDPRPWTPGACVAYSAPYLLKLGAFEAVVMDTSAALDSKVDEAQLRLYAGQLGSLHASNAFLVSHHPFWALKPTADNKLEPGTAVLAKAWAQTAPSGIRLMVAGHTHLFELFSFDGNRPPQLVAGDTATDLARAMPETVNGVVVHGGTILSSTSRRQYGYTFLTKMAAGWKLQLKDPEGHIVVNCTIQGNRAGCETK